MPRRRVMVPYPAEVIEEVDRFVERGERTAFLVSLAEREITLQRQLQALRAAKGAWKAKDHPELAGGAAKWVRSLRQKSIERFEKIEQHRHSK
jgi:hypothetical protein